MFSFLILCTSCGKKTKTNLPKLNGINRVSGICVNCGSKKSQFISKSEQQQTDLVVEKFSPRKSDDVT